MCVINAQALPIEGLRTYIKRGGSVYIPRNRERAGCPQEQGKI